LKIDFLRSKYKLKSVYYVYCTISIFGYLGGKRHIHNDFWNIITTTCCSLECLKSISYKDVEETQSKYLSLSSEVDERNFILTYLRDHTSCQRKGPGIVGEKTNFLVKGKSVCQKAWLIVHGINPKRFGRIVKGFEKGSEFYQHGNKLKLRTAVKTADCSSWISFLVNAIGDQQPDTGKIHLPSCFTKLSLYRKMCEELNNGENVVSKSQFYSIMAKQFAQVAIPKVRHDF
jgi:hypothetical protein